MMAGWPKWCTLTVIDKSGQRHSLDVRAESSFDAAHLYLTTAKTQPQAVVSSRCPFRALRPQQRERFTPSKPPRSRAGSSNAAMNWRVSGKSYSASGLPWPNNMLKASTYIGDLVATGYSEEERCNRLQEWVQISILRSYPNPNSIGCPSFDALLDIVMRAAETKCLDGEPRWEHVTHCSPCYREFLSLRTILSRPKYDCPPQLG